MITIHVPAICLHAGDPAGRVVAATPPCRFVEERGDLAAASSAGGAAQAAEREIASLLGRRGADRRAAQCDPAPPPSQHAADRNAGHGSALASRHRPPPLGQPVPAQTTRPPGGSPPCLRPYPPPGAGEPGMEIGRASCRERV